MITLHFKAFMLMHIMNFFLSMLINFLRKTHEFVDDAFVDVNGDDNFSFFCINFLSENHCSNVYVRFSALREGVTEIYKKFKLMEKCVRGKKIMKILSAFKCKQLKTSYNADGDE